MNPVACGAMYKMTSVGLVFINTSAVIIITDPYGNGISTALTLMILTSFDNSVFAFHFELGIRLFLFLTIVCTEMGV